MVQGALQFDSPEARIWAILRERRGAANAVSRDELVRLTGFSDRLIRQTIETLVTERRQPICSRYGEGGYFVPATAAEAAENAAVLHGHAVAMLRRAHVILGRPLAELGGQKQLFELGLLPGERGACG